MNFSRGNHRLSLSLSFKGLLLRRPRRRPDLTSTEYTRGRAFSSHRVGFTIFVGHTGEDLSPDEEEEGPRLVPGLLRLITKRTEASPVPPFGARPRAGLLASRFQTWCDLSRISDECRILALSER